MDCEAGPLSVPHRSAIPVRLLAFTAFRNARIAPSGSAGATLDEWPPQAANDAIASVSPAARSGCGIGSRRMMFNEFEPNTAPNRVASDHASVHQRGPRGYAAAGAPG